MTIKRNTRTPTDELAQRLNRALEQSETAFIEALMEITRERGFSSAAQASGIDRVTLHRYARGVGHPRFDTLIKLAASWDLKFNLVPKKS